MEKGGIFPEANESNLKQMERVKETSSSKAHEKISLKETKTVVESDYGKYPSFVSRAALNEIGSAVKPSFARIAAKKCAEEKNTVVESDYGKYPSLSESRWGGFENQSAIKPSFARTAAKKCAEVGDMILGQSVPLQKKMTVRPYSEGLTKATDGDEEILEEEAVCKSCFAKLHSEDITLKTRCGCASVLIHEKCLDNWCKVIFDNKDNCDACGKEVQKLPVILIYDVIPVKNESNKWSWSSWFKR